MINGPVNVILDFKKDSVSVYKVADSSMIEIMTYTNNDTSFTLTKIDGQSDCNTTTQGRYGFKIKKDTLSTNLITDECEDRSSVINSTKWIKWKAHSEAKLNEAMLQQNRDPYQMDKGHLITTNSFSAIKQNHLL